jgi:predicted ABC-type transport system involved in lysophospholipase L1 biosynthesis ATPase subunit
MITAGDLLDADEDGAAARQRFDELQGRAREAGGELRRVSSGFVFQRGTAIRHVLDLENIAALLKARESQR